MVIVVYGTTGELIKILPLLKMLPKDQILTICTYQQPEQLKRLNKETELPVPDIKIGRSPDAKDLEKMWQIPFWLIRVNLGFLKNAYLIKKQVGSRNRSVFLVHGDTMTTVVGAIWGRLLGFNVGHIEAGLRSHNWRHPFPEELDRLIVSRFARIHFAPGKIPENNLAKVRGEVIQTGFNTVLDSLRLAREDKTRSLSLDLPKKYAVVSIHRNELMAEKQILKHLLERLRDQAETDKIVFLDHPVTKQRIAELGYGEILKHKNITRLPKLTYFQFIKVVSSCNYIVTDSGGLQEEAAYLGIPCLVHRMATEREEGLGENVVLSKYSSKVLDEFLKSPGSFIREGLSSRISPTKTIINHLKLRKYLR